MFKLNQPIRTIKGELVVPFLVEGRLVHVIDMNKVQKIVDLSDFDFESKKKVTTSNVLMVKGTPPPALETLFDPQAGGYLGGAYEEKPIIVNPPIPAIIKVIAEPVINPIPIEIKAEAGTIFTVKQSVFTHYDDTRIITVLGKAITSYIAISKEPVDLTPKHFEYLIGNSFVRITGTAVRSFLFKQSFRYLVLIKPIKIIGSAISVKKVAISTSIANDFYGGM